MQRILTTISLCLLLGCAVSHRHPTTGHEPTWDGRVRDLEAYLALQFRSDGPGGVVLVARGERPVVRRAYGLADVAGERAMAVDQPLPIGSITKSFTAGAIVTLARTGRLTLDDDVRKHVAEAPVGNRVVTIEQLLTHTSGMPNLVDVPDFLDWAREPRSTAELLSHTAGVPFHFEPGQGFAYSDSGYILLGAVLERHHAGSWADVVRDLVAQPLNLESVDWAARLADRAAVGYEHDNVGFAIADAIDWSVPHASGALVATVDDLARWVRAWRDGDLATPELRERAWAGRMLPNGTYSGYGFGWKRNNFENRTAIQHGGHVPGFTASVLHLPDEDLTAIALLNSEGGVEASYLTRRALRLLLTGSPELAPHAMNAQERASLEGRYRSERGAIWTVRAEAQGLVLDLAGKRVDLAALSATVLCAADSDGTWCFTFELDQEGRASSIAVSLTGEPQARARRVE
jgi:D-alanyl-D-alanine carboxypeptidase